MFEDYSQAFDGMQRDVLWAVLIHVYGIPQEFVDLLKKFHDGFKIFTVLNNMYGEGFLTASGCRQGCIKGPDLWNMLFQCVMWAIAARMKRRDLKHGIDILYNPDGIIRKRSRAGSILDQIKKY